MDIMIGTSKEIAIFFHLIKINLDVKAIFDIKFIRYTIAIAQLVPRIPHFNVKG